MKDQTILYIVIGVLVTMLSSNHAMWTKKYAEAKTGAEAALALQQLQYEEQMRELILRYHDTSHYSR